ncbi:MAG: tetratricopeptide repeat protein [Candidatus Staskawiczbacteria bacterium]|nr:tetratricopeptide repeat protein [Candidatus Staskawiczbacteria bacterium]
MAKESSLTLKICDWAIKYSIYAAIFLMPIFFLPWTSDVLDFNKQAMLLLLVFVSFFALLLRILISGKFEIKKSLMHIIAGALFLAGLLATVFSAYRYGSFWGMPQQVSESLLTITSLLLLYFLVSNVFSRKEILISAIVLSFSAIIAEFIGILQLLSRFILPFDFAKSAAFNTLGSIGSLGFFAAITLPLAIVLLIIVKKWWRFLFVSEIIFSALILILINYSMIWWVVVIGSALTLALGIMKSDIIDGRWMALPTFFLALSLFFALLNPQISWLPQKTNEVFLSQNSGLDIALRTLKENPLFGSGLGTFAYDFSKFKSIDFSKSSLWNVTFNKSSSEILNSLPTTGILGFLALLAFMAFPIFYGVKFLVLKQKSNAGLAAEKPASQIYSILLLGLSVVLVEQSIAYFLYNSNITLAFFYFFTIAALIGLIPETKKEYALKPSSLLTLITTLVFTLVFIFGMGVLILNGQRYIAEVNYYQGLAAYQAGNKTDGLKKMESAVSLNSQSDLYFRQLSQVYFLTLQDKLQNVKSNISDQQKIEIQNLVANSINAGKIATDLNPKDAGNWSSRGYVYQSLIGVSGGAETWAINSYDSALKLDPNNPYLFAQEGNVYLAEAENLSDDQASQKNQLLVKAQTQLEKAVFLNPNYSNALYSLGIVYDALGKKSKAIDAFTKLQQLNPTNADIAKILNNLNAGNSISQTATPPAANPPSGNGGNGAVQNPPAKSPAK